MRFHNALPASHTHARTHTSPSPIHLLITLKLASFQVLDVRLEPHALVLVNVVNSIKSTVILQGVAVLQARTLALESEDLSRLVESILAYKSTSLMRCV